MPKRIGRATKFPSDAQYEVDRQCRRNCRDGLKEEQLEITPVRTNKNYKAALKEIGVPMASDPALGTHDGDRLDILSTLVHAYEQKALPMELPDPVEAIKFRMDQQGLTAKDLEPMIGQRKRVYEILNRKRPLTLAMVWRLHTGLGIPAQSLIRQPA